MATGKRTAASRGPSATRRVFGALWYLAFCGFVLLAATALGWLGRTSLLRNPLTLLNPPKPQQAFHKDVQTFLILGCDQDVYYQGLTVLKHAARSDMMLVARMDFDNHQITGVSIPRDTWCRLPGFSTHKINAYHAIAKYGEGDQLTKRAVEHLIGVPIDRVLVLDYSAMQRLVDIVGGVPVTVPRAMDYDDNAGKLHIHLKPGPQRLGGYDAMGYVRFRHSNDKRLAETDFQRQEREKDLLLGFKEAALSNFMRLPEIAEAGKAVLGGGLTDEQILSLAGFARGVGQNRIRLGVVPTRQRGNGLEVDERKLPEVLAEYRLLDDRSPVTVREP